MPMVDKPVDVCSWGVGEGVGIFFPGDFFVFEKTESKFSEWLFAEFVWKG